MIDSAPLLRAPFPWFGGKSRVTALVWERFGAVANYVEPFFGSGAVLLGRPDGPGIETVNDLDCMVANFWRALQAEPDAVARYADEPVNEADQHARHLWLCSQEGFRERMKVAPEFYDARIAGWWVWGQCVWIGSGWCAKRLPHLSNAGQGVHRQLPHLGNAGQGVHRNVPLYDYMGELAARLRRVRVCCGGWERVCTPAVTSRLGLTGIFLDPPYDDGELRYAAGGIGEGVSAHVRAWAVENGDDPMLRIALCGYEGEHALPETWECVPWKAHGGYGSGRGNAAEENAYRERIWFSPHCLSGRQGVMFA